MNKRFSVKHGVGKARHVVNHHDGLKKHADGSDFFDVQIFGSKKKMEVFVKSLRVDGYAEIV